jgi:hypothetical protein
VEDAVRKKLKILFNEKEVKQIYLNTVTLLCSGNEPIRSADYESPIEVKFGTDVEILSAEIVKPSQRCLGPSIEIENETLTLAPILMNHGDRIDLKVLTESRPKKIEIDARIAGVDEIKAIGRHAEMSFWMYEVGLASLGGSLLVFSWYARAPFNFFDWPFVSLLILTSIGFSLLVASRFIKRPKL